MRRTGAGVRRECPLLGIDGSKAPLADSLLTDDRRRLLAEGTVPNTPAGIRQLLAATPADRRRVVEPTGAYSAPLVRHAHAQAFLRALTPRAKTDRLDRRGLAHYALAVPLRPDPVTAEAVEDLEQLLAARKGLRRSRAQLTQQPAVLPAAAAPLAAAITALTEQLQALDRQRAQLIRQPDLAVAQALDRIPGVGPVTAAAVAACLQTRHFSHPDQFVAYCGRDVQVRDSGQHRGQRRLAKQGDAELRRLLYLCAPANVRSRDPDNPFKRQYQRERAKGLPTTGALVAVARKLARTCWSLVTHGTTYDPHRVHRHPNHHEAALPLDNQP